MIIELLAAAGGAAGCGTGWLTAGAAGGGGCTAIDCAGAAEVVWTAIEVMTCVEVGMAELSATTAAAEVCSTTALVKVELAT
jgi:hypothetical protein